VKRGGGHSQGWGYCFKFLVESIRPVLSHPRGGEKALCWRNCRTVKFCRRRKTSSFLPPVFWRFKSWASKKSKQFKALAGNAHHSPDIFFCRGRGRPLFDGCTSQPWFFLRKSSLKLVENRWSLKLLLSADCDILSLVNGTKVTRSVRGQMNVGGRIFRIETFTGKLPHRLEYTFEWQLKS
jgi:hypothetical protein